MPSHSNLPFPQFFFLPLSFEGDDGTCQRCNEVDILSSSSSFRARSRSATISGEARWEIGAILEAKRGLAKDRRDGSLVKNCPIPYAKAAMRRILCHHTSTKKLNARASDTRDQSPRATCLVPCMSYFSSLPEGQLTEK